MISITIDMEMFKNYLYNNAVLITHEFQLLRAKTVFIIFFFLILPSITLKL